MKASEAHKISVKNSKSKNYSNISILMNKCLQDIRTKSLDGQFISKIDVSMFNDSVRHEVKQQLELDGYLVKISREADNNLSKFLPIYKAYLVISW